MSDRNKDWLKARKEWVMNNPPSHDGYYLCALCGKRVFFLDFELDHIRGRKGNYLVDQDNLQPTCSVCNRLKGSKKVDSLVSASEYELRRKLEL